MRLVLRWIPAAAWMAVIFALSSVPGSNIPGRFSTLGHFITYAILGALLALPLGSGRSRGTAIALAVTVASLYAISDEFHQAFVPMRTPDVADWGVDTLGSFVGAWAAVTIAHLRGARAGAREGA